MSGIFGKKQVLLATLIVALGLAVYLNYYFANKAPTVPTGTGTSSSDKNLGDAQYVGNPSTVSGGDTSTTEDPSDYFVQARLNRENARQEQLDIVKDMMNDVKATDEIKKQAADKVEAVTKAIEQESKSCLLYTALIIPQLIREQNLCPFTSVFRRGRKNDRISDLALDKPEVLR